LPRPNSCPPSLTRALCPPRPALAPHAAPQRRPITVKTLTSATLFCVGDVLSQKLEGRENMDLARLVRMTAWGGMFAPFAHYWYGALDRMIPGSGASVVAKKVAADQVRRRRGLARGEAGAMRSGLKVTGHIHGGAERACPRSAARRAGC
jgi:hypothetical protein